MLVPAYLHTTVEDINKLINRNPSMFISYSPYKKYNVINEIQNDEWNMFQYVSINSDGKIMGYYSAIRDQMANMISGCLFIHFKKEAYYEQETASKDLREFINMLATLPMINMIYFNSVVDNKANATTYKEFIDKYNGCRYIMKKYARLTDGKIYDCYQYQLDVEGYEEDLGGHYIKI